MFTMFLLTLMGYFIKIVHMHIPNTSGHATFLLNQVCCKRKESRDKEIKGQTETFVIVIQRWHCPVADRERCVCVHACVTLGITVCPSRSRQDTVWPKSPPHDKQFSDSPVCLCVHVHISVIGFVYVYVNICLSLCVSHNYYEAQAGVSETATGDSIICIQS